MYSPASLFILSNRDDDFSQVKCTVRVSTIFSSFYIARLLSIIVLKEKFSSFSVVQNKKTRPRSLVLEDFKQLLDDVFLISGIIKVEESVISRTEGRDLYYLGYHKNRI